jgi:hypothetical protein
MKFLRDIFRLLPLNSTKDEQRRFFEPFTSDKAKLKQMPTTKSFELTQEQLADILNWLSLY